MPLRKPAQKPRRTAKVQTMLTREEADALREESAHRTVAARGRVSVSDILRSLVIAHLKKTTKE